MSGLFEKIGGENAVNLAVDVFYKKVLANSKVSSFFEGVDMERQAQKQKSFLTFAFGGPNNYSGADMRRGHAHLVEKGLNDEHFDIIVQLLAESLTELSVSADLIAQVKDIAESTRNDVLNKVAFD